MSRHDFGFGSHASIAGIANMPPILDVWSRPTVDYFGISTTVRVIGPISITYFCPECQKTHQFGSKPCETISPDKAARLGAFFDIKDGSQY